MSTAELFAQDAEMQNALVELRQAQDMLDNAENRYRIDEACYRIKAAEARIQAIRYERGGGERADNVAGNCKLDILRRRMRNAGLAGKGGYR